MQNEHQRIQTKELIKVIDLKIKALSLLLLCLALSGWVKAQSISLPMSMMPSGQDSVHSSDGVSCQSFTGARRRQMEVGIYGQNPQSNPVFSGNSPQVGAYGVYSKLIINLDSDTPKPIDCNPLLELEVDRMRRETQMDALAPSNQRPKMK